ncbi:hypothetical protein B0A48_14295 [Cryoendolithus antarcticus]|uniref:F-box domain-containing protein n=1 Tax=Cryoendolithus antarcticus TaxID=1507870 RepID=A0A1V8SJR8_9PEZI|nr:hypothetical protein B0A48_14295 [Cryoendolithus antarcticus]
MAAAEKTSITPGSITRAAATQKFFAIVELVEQVLLYKSVTMENLFVLQRINKTVQGIIRGSQLLQRKMHLALETKFDGTAPTQYNTIFSIPPGYIGRFPYHSITNKRISNAFGNFAIVLLPGTDGGLMMGPTFLAVKIVQSITLEKPSGDSIVSDPSPSEQSISMPAMPAAMSAVQQVFSVVELTERILLWIGMKQLFVLQRVNKAFQAVIRGSLPLRRQMYLVFGPKPTIQSAPRFSRKVFTDTNPYDGAISPRYDRELSLATSIIREAVGEVCIRHDPWQNMFDMRLHIFFFAKGEADLQNAASGELGGEDGDDDEDGDESDMERKREKKMERRREWERHSKRQRYWKDLTVPCSRCSPNPFDEPDFSMKERFIAEDGQTQSR